ncbi:NACHT, LRR and PYD domains-containing protein 3-like isoform X2 [Notolabrus celidotus]|uniref:NACHT, LRR and PYD domains-containing protein 3-like isoform X2 n=1 Tax=Notolabrus celidotus TaxID=1203425 RepID=UPI00148F8BCA|nr:NACHT, LRR and PYD domains-containing protein 3-like isoform X2 [Notolabrus celidotus]
MAGCGNKFQMDKEDAELSGREERERSSPLRFEGAASPSLIWAQQENATHTAKVERHGYSGRPVIIQKHRIIVRIPNDGVKQKLRDHLREKYTFIKEGTSASRSRLEQIYTRVFITEQHEDYGCKPHEILDQLKLPDDRSPFSPYEEINCLSIFKPGRKKSQQQPEDQSPIRRVMTKGIAGIGKTVAVQNFALDWAEGKSNQHIDFLFVLPFRELNLLKEAEYTLLQLLLHFYPELRPFKDAQPLLNSSLLFIFDGLDESRFPLDFEGGARISNVDQQAAVNVLLTNLIKGNLLPDALLWITSRPAAVGQIPSKYIDQMTEVQGFTERHKEEYFLRRFGTSGQAGEALSCVRGMISFHFMGHIPIFCWILAEVFTKGWSDQRSRGITTMTELYIYYLIIQTQRSAEKYGVTTSSRTKNKKKKAAQKGSMIFSISKLAFEQLQKGNIIFYEEDLRECGIDVNRAAVFCGLCSEILKQEHGLYKKQMFSFVHLSFQEFLAALHMFHCCVTKEIHTLQSFLEVDPTDLSLLELQKRVIDKALKSEKGQLDLFLCFFLGFFLESNQTLLQSVLPQTQSSSHTVLEMKKYLRNFHAGNIAQERCMNLFLCKYELREESFQADVRRYLDAGARLSPIDCSVLSTMLQISGELVEELDLTVCNTPLYGVEKLVTVMKNSRKAVLSRFTLDFRHCHILACILQSKQSSLRALDLADCIYSYQQDYSKYFSEELEAQVEYEDFTDDITLLTFIPAGLIGPLCKLEEFSMPGCRLTNKCCQVFASVLSSNSQLRELDLSRNDLQDSGVLLLSAGLGSSTCRLEKLRLSYCGITEEGCASLASALRSNPSHLRELDMSYNHPGEAGVRLLSERLLDPGCRLERLNVDHDEELWINMQLLNKYACDLTLVPDTLHKKLVLSEGEKKVSSTEEEQPYPDHPERFDQVMQVLCREGLTGRCYWEVEWTGFVGVGVAYKSLERKGHLLTDIQLSNKAWMCTVSVWNGYSFFHGRRETFIPVPFINVKAFLARRRRLGLFLDWIAGMLSFYSLSGDKKTLLHTFHTTFTEPLHPVFSVHVGSVTISTAKMLRMDNAKLSFTPEVIPERLGVSYRFQFPGAGVFECSLTGLVFKVTHEGEVTYKTLIWDQKLLEPARKVPGGPLFSIRCPQDSICQLHLPHCEPEPGLVSEALCVVHITEDGMSIIKPLEITDSHVVVETPHLSAFGIVYDLIQRFRTFMNKPVCGQVLLFLRRAYRGVNLILSMILLPSNVPLQEVKAQYEKCEYIQAPSYCLLHKTQHYSLQTEPEGFTVQPHSAVFFENYGPNFHALFEVTLTTSTEEVTLMVRDPEGTQVWVHSLHLPALSTDDDEKVPSRRSRTSAEEKLQRARTQFIDRVSDPVLNKMLDELLLYKVLSDAESEASRVKPRADKARDVIDMVRKKGGEASLKMITIFSSNDPFLCRDLSLA